jgi:hypothetical protein
MRMPEATQLGERTCDILAGTEGLVFSSISLEVNTWTLPNIGTMSSDVSRPYRLTLKAALAVYRAIATRATEELLMTGPGECLSVSVVFLLICLDGC